MHCVVKWSLLLIQLIIITTQTTAETPQPYCYKNITETSYKMVTKTRLKNVSSKNFFKKMIAKKDTQIEIYEHQEPVFKIKVERVCCEGYKMTEYDLCEPQCIENGCPQYSKCVEPEVCECLMGYFSTRSAHDGKHYCQPLCEEPCPEYSECVGPNQCACKKGYINVGLKCMPHCDSGCPFGGACNAPNNCSCQAGYRSTQGSCLATCSLGDHCKNGQCIAQDVCICDYGFQWNNETFKCVLDEMETSTYYPNLKELQQQLNSLMETETDIESSSDDIDPNEVFDENIKSTFFDEIDGFSSTASYPVTTNHKCPDDYVFHKGQCFPLKFASTEVDCWQKPCVDANAVCLENGTCACKEGFKLFKTYSNESNSSNKTITTNCLTPEEYEIRTQELNENTEQKEITDATSWSSIFFIVLGVLILAFALVFLGIKLLLRQTGEIDVEGKNLACTYDNRGCGDTEKSVI